MPRPRTTLWVCVFVLLVAPGCDQGRPTAARPRSDGEVSAPNNDLFDSLRVLQIALDIAPPELAVLKTNNDSHAYVRCTVREGGLTLTDVGIHCQGDPVKEFASGKPDFTITFDKFVRRREFHGQERLILHSSRDDPSYLSAPIAFELFRQAGIPSPRCAFASVELNGRDLGLYVINEGVNRDFLRQHFREPKGKLHVYDERRRNDPTGKPDEDDGEEGAEPAALKPLAVAVRETNPGERWEQLRQQLDMDRFLAFTAMEVLLWKRDSYAYTLRGRKVRIYHDPATDRLVFFPKGVERVLAKTDGAVLPECEGDVTVAVLTTPEGRKQYLETLGKLLKTVFVPEKVQARAREIAAAIRPAAVGDDANAAKAFDAAVARFQDAVAKREDFVAGQLKGAAAASGRAEKPRSPATSIEE